MKQSAFVKNWHSQTWSHLGRRQFSGTTATDSSSRNCGCADAGRGAGDRSRECGGFTHRRYGNDFGFWLPEHLELQEIISRFDGITLDAITRQPVRLEYMEVTQA